MPIYEYECQDCGHRLDALQKISEPVLVQCPQCQEDSLRRLVSAPAFRLKGGGWYETDFKKDQRRNIADGDDKPPASKKADGDASKSPEPKPKSAAKEKARPAPKSAQ